MKLYDAHQRPVLLGNQVGRGGEAAVYCLENQPDLLAKVFEPAPRPDYPAKLAWMAAHPPQDPTLALGQPSLAWPRNLLYTERRQLAGYLMPYIRLAVPLLAVYNPLRRQQGPLRFDRRYLHRTARNLAAAVASLHLSGYVAGDLSGNNALVTSTALITLIDTDSFQVQEEQNGHLVLHPCPVGNPEYLAPELVGRSLPQVTRLPEQDNFALGVLIFQLLMQGGHPFRAQWLGSGDPPSTVERIQAGLYPYQPKPPGPVRPAPNSPPIERLDPGLAELFRQCFVDGHADPRKRPSPSIWRKALVEAEERLKHCPRGHYYSAHLSNCPECSPGSALERLSTRRGAAPRRIAADRAGAASTTAPPIASAAQAVPRRSAASSSNPVPAGRAAAAPAATPAGPRSLGQSAPGSPPASGAFRPAARSTGVRRASSRPHPVPYIPSARRKPGGMELLRRRLRSSLLAGGLLGALIGLVPAGLVGAAFHAARWALPAYLPWALGGAAAGLWRGWDPSYRLGQQVGKRIGWYFFWQVTGMALGGLLGAGLGLFFYQLVFPPLLGLVIGGYLGRRLGERLFFRGKSYGWERIWAIGGTLLTAVLGALLAGLLGVTPLGAWTQGLPAGLSVQFAAQGQNPALAWSLAGALAGLLGGALAGFSADFIARLAGLLD